MIPIESWIKGMTAPCDIIHNYIVPGLKSTMLMKSDSGAKVRVFEMTRNQQLFIAPHSHRYDFACHVIEGYVLNTIYRETESADGDLFQAVKQTYGDRPGEYEYTTETKPEYYDVVKTRFNAGEWYGMEHGEIHTINFSKHAKVLFMEGPDLRNHSVTLQPVVNDQACDISFNADWMFKQNNSMVRHDIN